MLKLEIKLNEQKIVSEHQYSLSSIYQAIENAFAKYGFHGERLSVVGAGTADSFIITEMEHVPPCAARP